MTLPEGFQFSQASLQDYVDCPRRFQLRYLVNLDWPAVEAEPVLKHERHMERAGLFHQMVHQLLLGIPHERLTPFATGEDELARWWAHFLEARPDEVPGARHPEVTLSVPFVGSRLVAKYDLVVVTSEGDLTIFDWKTSRRRPSRRRLAERIQTRVYRALVVEAGAYLNGGRPVVPSRVRMTYWFADFPHQPETFVYDEVEHRADVDLLTQLIAEVRARAAEEDFALTDEERRCAYCTYRSLCRRGVEGGNLESWEAEEESDDLSDFDLDLDQVAEVEF